MGLKNQSLFIRAPKRFLAKFEFYRTTVIKFIFYYCFLLDEWCKKNTTVGNFPGVDMNGFKKFRIPIPPLQTQEEIVRILDTFTELTAELTAELAAREKQYEYYRNKLLTFSELTGGGSNG